MANSVRALTQALDALWEAHRAASCVRCMLAHIVEIPIRRRYFLPNELAALQAVVDSEVERRLQLVRSTVVSAFVP